MKGKVKCGHSVSALCRIAASPHCQAVPWTSTQPSKPSSIQSQPRGCVCVRPSHFAPLSCLARPLFPGPPPQPQTFSSSLFGFNPAGLFLVLGGGSICAVKVFATLWHFLPPSLPLNIWLMLLTPSVDPLCDWPPFASVNFNPASALCTNSRCWIPSPHPSFCHTEGPSYLQRWSPGATVADTPIVVSGLLTVTWKLLGPMHSPVLHGYKWRVRWTRTFTMPSTLVMWLPKSRSLGAGLWICVTLSRSSCAMPRPPFACREA